MCRGSSHSPGPVSWPHGHRRCLSRCRDLLARASRHAFGDLPQRVNRHMASCPCRCRKAGLTCIASRTTRTPRGCSSVAERGPSRLETGVRFPPIRSSSVQPSQGTSLMRRAPQPPHRIDAAFPSAPNSQSDRLRSSFSCNARAARIDHVVAHFRRQHVRCPKRRLDQRRLALPSASSISISPIPDVTSSFPFPAVQPFRHLRRRHHGSKSLPALPRYRTTGSGVRTCLIHHGRGRRSRWHHVPPDLRRLRPRPPPCRSRQAPRSRNSAIVRSMSSRRFRQDHDAGPLPEPEAIRAPDLRRTRTLSASFRMSNPPDLSTSVLRFAQP